MKKLLGILAVGGLLSVGCNAESSKTTTKPAVPAPPAQVTPTTPTTPAPTPPSPPKTEAEKKSAPAKGKSPQP